MGLPTLTGGQADLPALAAAYEQAMEVLRPLAALQSQIAPYFTNADDRPFSEDMALTVGQVRAAARLVREFEGGLHGGA